MLVPKLVTVFQEGYGLDKLRKDTVSGITVAVVALPLAMAIAIASGTTPDKGLITAIVAGFLISALGGSRHQIGGPTAAFVIVVYGVIQKHGYDGMLLAALMAGGILVLAGLFRLGTLIKFIPDPVITGFTAGIALTILSTQIKDLFGLSMAEVPADFLPKWWAYIQAAPSVNWLTTGIGLLTIAVILLVRRFLPAWPNMLTGIVAATLLVQLFHLPVETISDRFGQIPNTLPAPVLPAISLARAMDVLPSAITIALLAGIESLLSCVIADGMAGRRHRSNIELIGQGIANIASAMIGGLPATGALARTATNIKAGAVSPVSGMLHALFLLIILWVAGPLAGMIPLSALAGLLVIVAWNMSEVERILHFAKAPQGDRAVLFVTLLLTVLVDLTVAIQVGIALAALIFMRRMVYASEVSEVSTATLAERAETEGGASSYAALDIPPDVQVFQMEGPFFFGVASRLADVLERIKQPPKVFILRMGNVPLIDASGVAALETFIERSAKRGTEVLLTRINPQPWEVLERMGVFDKLGRERIFRNLPKALERARQIVGVPPVA